jgi:hypothetical protein
LALSTAWVFHSARKVALKYLKKARIDPIDRLVLVIKYDIDDWTVDTLNDIAQREDPLDSTDADRLLSVVGVDYLLKIAQVRETMSTPPPPGAPASSCSCNYHGTLPAGTSCSVFGLEE